MPQEFDTWMRRVPAARRGLEAFASDLPARGCEVVDDALEFSATTVVVDGST